MKESSYKNYDELPLFLNAETVAKRRPSGDGVRPRLGAKPLTQLTASDLRKLYDILKQSGRVKPRSGQGKGLSSTTVRSIHTTLHHALKTAKRSGAHPRQPG